MPHIWTPKSFTQEPKYVCTVPKADGLTCGKPFYEDEREKYERHAVKCAQENAESIHKLMVQTRTPISGGVPDLEEWVAKHREELIEGRKKL